MKAYVFGAGASVHAHYPLASKLWPSVEVWARNEPNAHIYRSAADNLNELFDTSKPFEMFLTELDDRISHTPDQSLVSLRNHAQMMVYDYLNSIRGNPAEFYRLFAQSILTPQDTVITFNYDVSLDRELRRSGKWNVLTGYGFVIDQPYGFAIDQPTVSPSCKLLKLHGSTNWIAQVLGGLQGAGAVNPDEPLLGWRPVIPTPEMIYLGTDLVDRRFRMGTGFAPMLIMPVANKKFFIPTSFDPRELEGFWSSLWLQAREVIAASDEVHIIGYSLPEYDNRARDLLLRTMRREAEVSICCRSGTNDLIKLFRDSGFTKARAGADGTFEGWVKANSRISGYRIQSDLSAARATLTDI
jgi:hypothetical protein